MHILILLKTAIYKGFRIYPRYAQALQQQPENKNIFKDIKVGERR